jgi:parallel beta-helix repeat protein
LEALGTAENLVTFTSASAAPAKGSRKGVWFYDTSLDTSVINFAKVEYAQNGVYCNSASPTISNVAFSENFTGIYLTSSNTLVKGCAIKNSRDQGIYLTSSSPQVLDNHIAYSSIGIHCEHSNYQCVGFRQYRGHYRQGKSQWRNRVCFHRDNSGWKP